jgi:hypothetical protein
VKRFERVIEATLLDLNKSLHDFYQLHATAQRLTRVGLKLENSRRPFPT